MRVTIFGSGYVGLVTGACFADAGNHVICVDVDARKIEALNRGEIPIHEPGLEDLIERNAIADHPHMAVLFEQLVIGQLAHGRRGSDGLVGEIEVIAQDDLSVSTLANRMGREVGRIPRLGHGPAE